MSQLFDRLSRIVAGGELHVFGVILSATTACWKLISSSPAQAQPQLTPFPFPTCDVEDCISTERAAAIAAFEACTTWAEQGEGRDAILVGYADCISTSSNAWAAAVRKCHEARCGAGNYCYRRSSLGPGNRTTTVAACCPRGEGFSTVQGRCVPCTTINCASPYIPDTTYCTCVQTISP